jgi:hypothetical protein
MVVTRIGVDLHQPHTVNNNGHKGIGLMLPMVVVGHLLGTVSVVVMVVKGSSLSTNLFDINNKEGDK